MADSEEQYTEKNLPASQKRKDEARAKGNVAKSRELISAAMILGAALIVHSLWESSVTQFINIASLNWSLAFPSPTSPENLHHLIVTLIGSTLWIIVPIVSLFCLIAVFSSVGQYGLLWSSEGIMPNWDRVDPIAGFSRIFSMTAFFELAKTSLKFLVIGFVVYKIVEHDIPQILVSTQMAPDTIIADIARVTVRILFYSGLVVLVIGVLDFGYQWWEREKQLRMTPQEMKEELKQTEGNPLIKARVHAIQRQMARKRMMIEVPKAAVVITNPTHLAIALSYDPDNMSAPRVVAKGADFMAQKIREIATANGVPLVENKPLAQDIFKTVSIGGEIPAHLYRAVAEILVYVYKLRGEGRLQGQGTEALVRG
ncbi:MAG: flagellar biosynthesis protein FlhB [Nitrospirota bacterium]